MARFTRTDIAAAGWGAVGSTFWGCFHPQCQTGSYKHKFNFLWLLAPSLPYLYIYIYITCIVQYNFLHKFAAISQVTHHVTHKIEPHTPPNPYMHMSSLPTHSKGTTCHVCLQGRGFHVEPTRYDVTIQASVHVGEDICYTKVQTTWSKQDLVLLAVVKEGPKGYDLTKSPLY